ncbi:MAG: DUF3109 family protein [Lewinellaceae bacterium]|nr:DUF3109 family protein [Saprospiraceae bacterium]MCB9307622.1 DUF3109 family protein [Lewinellaceae bacterium]MCB9354512.1 DUF3109 family protein [Lewinellaceae bacterium]
MIIVQDKLVSDELVEQRFVCNLNACKGACCWEGDYGAPLDEAELPVLDSIFEQVKSFLSPAGIAAIEAQGRYIRFEETKEWTTPLIDNGPCAYMVYDELGIAKCGIEQAWKAGVSDFQKPVSCHLYPVRVEKNEELGFEALNYHEWDICSAACELGEKQQIPVYRFVKDALIRKYGVGFYDELDGAALFMEGQKQKK